MTRSMTTAFVFLTSFLVQVSLFYALPEPFVFFPFHLLIGIVIAHRSEAGLGILWFFLSAVFFAGVIPAPGTALAFGAVGFASTILISRVFANRSVYALIGFGLVLFTIYIFIKSLFSFDLNEIVFGYLSVTIGLYFGFLGARLVERSTRKLFLIRT